MASPARKLRNDEREKPRESSRNVELPYPVECPALVTHDDIVRAWSVLFLPAFAAGIVVKSLHATTDNGLTWPTVRQKKLTLEHVREAVIAHLNAGKAGEPCPLDGEGSIHAIGVRFAKDEPTCIMNVDLDGGVEPHEFVRSLAKNGVRGLLTSSSGKPQKYRLLVFLDRWFTVGEVQVLGKTLCKRLGFKVGKGAVEIFPSTVNGRLPCGHGALTVYDRTSLDEGVALTLPAFLRTFYALPRVGLDRIVDELSFAADQRERPELSKDSIDRAEKRLSGQVETLERKVASNESTSGLPRRIVEGRCPPSPQKVRLLKKNGITGPDQRHEAIYEIVKDSRYRRMPQSAAIALVCDMFDAGKFDASEDADTPEKREREKKKVPDRVRNIYETHELPGRPLPAVLTKDEYIRAREYAEHAASASGEPVKTCLSFIHGMLSLCKAARLANLPHVRIHNKEMRRMGGAKYAVIRDACEGLFIMTETHRSYKSLRRMGLSEQSALEYARARSYKTTFAFDL